MILGDGADIAQRLSLCDAAECRSAGVVVALPPVVVTRTAVAASTSLRCWNRSTRHLSRAADEVCNSLV